MIRTKCLPVILLFLLAPTAFSSLALAADTLNAQLHGIYGQNMNFACVTPVPDAQGNYPPIPHFAEVAPGTYQLLVEAETQTIVGYGRSQFNGDGTWSFLEANVLGISHGQTSIGGIPAPPQGSLSCEGQYTVHSDRTVELIAEKCLWNLPGELPLIAELGPFIYDGYLSTDTKTLVLSDITPQKGAVQVKLGEMVVAEYEGLCVQTVTMIKITNDPLQFAQFGNGSGFTSDLVITNPTNVDAAGHVVFRDDDGEEMAVPIAGLGTQTSLDFTVAPQGSTTISTTGEGSAEAGSALLTADQELGGVVRFSIPGIGVAGVGVSQPLSAFISPVRRKSGGINTGLAITNTEAHPVSLLLMLRDEAGKLVSDGGRTIADFPAGAHLSQFIQQLFPNSDTRDFAGTIVVQVTGGRVAATVIELDTVNKKFTTMPVTPIG